MRSLLGSIGLLLAFPWVCVAAEPQRTPESEKIFAKLGEDYAVSVRPLLKQFCLDCHSTEKQEGELDLEQFAKLEQVRSEPRAWLKVVEMLDNGEMPPKKSPQPTAGQRKQIRDWVKEYLEAEGRANAGDPGAVVLRRLSNVEYDNTVRDLTGIDLKPAREFPADSAAGEGFTNVGEALVMSPAMLDKYIASAKGIASHAVLLPNGFRFSEKNTRPDWTDELLTDIRGLYKQYTDPAGSTRVNLQGLTWETNSGGRIPLEPYLASLVEHRAALAAGTQTFKAVADESHLSPKYLQAVWTFLTSSEPSPLADPLREKWKSAKLEDIKPLAAEIRRWQAALTQFKSVGHFKPWQEPVTPLLPIQGFHVKIDPNLDPQKEIVLRLVVRDAGDGSSGDLVEWQHPRFEAPGRPALLLRDLQPGLQGLAVKRQTLKEAAKYLAAVDEARKETSKVDAVVYATARQLDPDMLAAWFDYLGVVAQGDLKIEGYLAGKQERAGSYDFVKGWGGDLPTVLANSSDQQVRIPGIMNPHAVVVHPTPTQTAAVGWRSPLTGQIRIEARVVHAHPECGNGLAWALELRRGGERRRLAAGETDRAQAATIAPIDNFPVHSGDLLSLQIGPRASDHSCDLTEVDLVLTEVAGEKRKWSLAGDVSPDILAGNPHADRLGHRDVWHFYTEKIAGENSSTLNAVPRGSVLDKWRDATAPDERTKLAGQLQTLLTAGVPAGTTEDQPDAVLYRQLNSLNGPLFGRLDFAQLAADTLSRPGTKENSQTEFGLHREKFGIHPQGKPVDGHSLLQTPSTLEIRLPAGLVAGREFIAVAAQDQHAGLDGSVQTQVLLNELPEPGNIIPGLPVIVQDGRAARQRFVAWLVEFRSIFPAALCYPQIVPVDEVVTVALYHREDDHLKRLMLDEAQGKRLDRLWEELWFVSQEAAKVEVGYKQFMEYVTQDGDVRLFEPLRKPIADRAAAYRKELLATEPVHVGKLLEFAARAYRRPLQSNEQTALKALYARLREEGLDHDAAFRLLMARVLMAPAFLYKAEQPAEGTEPRAVSDFELASRLSYFLWSTMPDAELWKLAAEGKLHEPEVLRQQTRRMLQDPRVRNLGTEFGCQWLDIRGFDQHNEKSEQVFPEFAALRGPMYEESVRFLVDLFQRDGSILEVLDADHTFVNAALAKHYGLPNVAGNDWRRVDGVKAQGRGGILGMATLLSKQSGASRTSPILRGNWLVETLLGEKLPKPPKNVPQLPESELDTNGLTMRQITEKHTQIESCAKCHDKIDAFGFALEGFDAIGRRRATDLGDRPIDTAVKLKDGTKFTDISGLRTYILEQRRDEYLHQFCKKLLGYSLGRAVQLSDGPLLQEMQSQLKAHDYKFSAALDTIVGSQQFRFQRGSNAESVAAGE